MPLTVLSEDSRVWTPPLATTYNYGDMLTFGKYQDEPIEWRVLAVEDGKALVVSEKILDAKPYHTNSRSFTWETSAMRFFLNDLFYRYAFTPDERARIMETDVINDENTSHGTAGGNNTRDSIFLLSLDETEKYFLNDEERMAFSTTYAWDQGLNMYFEEAGWWWLRSPGRNDYCAAYVNSDGSVNDVGSLVYFVSLDIGILGGMRPALWISTLQPSSSAFLPGLIYKPSDTLTYGQYQHEPIEWRVLAVEDARVLVISEKILDVKPYNREQKAVTWEVSSIRTWLNGYFYLTAFTPDERNRIMETWITNNDAHWGTKGGNNTLDKVFLLSWDEAGIYSDAGAYFANSTERIAFPTTYAKKRDGAAGYWWLRSPGRAGSFVEIVDSLGVVQGGGGEVSCETGIRPVLWLNTQPVIPESLLNISTPVTEIPHTFTAAIHYKQGDILTFGSYQNEPIEWRVLAVKDGKALVVSEKILDARPYNIDNEDVTWESCTLRVWLNGDFLRDAFTLEEREFIVETIIKNDDNAYMRTEGGYNTQDKLFALSIDEAESYFSNDEARIALPTDYAKEQHIIDWWWLRSPGFDNRKSSAVFSGKVDRMGTCDVANIRGGVRPALWMSTQPVIIESSLPTLTPVPTPTPVPTQTLIPTNTPMVTLAPIMKPVEIISFGNYQDEPITWRVLAVEDGKTLVISEKILDAKLFHTERTAIWATCSLRVWLNEDFYQSAFTPEERSNIAEIPIEKDKVFLLSVDEALKYFENDEDRFAVTTTYAEKKDLKVSSAGNCAWWLRSNGITGGISDRWTAAYVGIEGIVSVYGINVNYNESGVRPALWLNP